MIPNYLIIGVQKGGTTSAQYTFSKHPEIFIAPGEMHYFDNKYSKGLNWYKSQFPKGKKTVGEKTPKYIFKSICIDRIYRNIPKVKLVLILRDPVKRFFSQLNMEHGNVSQQEFNKIARQAIRRRTNVLQRGFYFEQIQHVLSKFPRNQLHIAISEHVKQNPKKEYNKMFKFIGVSELDDVPYNTNVHKRTYKNAIQKVLQDRLVRIYKPHNEKLFQFLGFRVANWL